jgi:histidinol-phosphate aminotransferase
VLSLPTYHPPLADRTGLRLDFNENTAGCSPRVLKALRAVDAEQLSRYPERTPIESVVARHLEVESDEVLLTNGIDEGLHLLCETYLQSGDEVLIPVPTFAMYELFAAATGAAVISVPAGSDFAFPFEQLRNRISPRTRLIAVANPNNPTGALVAPELLIDLARFAPSAAILVDEAYFEFCDKTMLRGWRDLPNLFVARTFSKAYGLAGLRVGVLLGHKNSLAAVRRVASPYSVNGVALACLPAALADQEYVSQYVDQVLQGRLDLQQRLREWNIRFWASRANFVLIYVGEKHAEFALEMRARGILVRDRSGDPGCAGCVRITIGTLDQTRQLQVELADVFACLGMLKPELSR